MVHADKADSEGGKENRHCTHKKVERGDDSDVDIPEIKESDIVKVINDITGVILIPKSRCLVADKVDGEPDVEDNQIKRQH